MSCLGPEGTEAVVSLAHLCASVLWLLHTVALLVVFNEMSPSWSASREEGRSLAGTGCLHHKYGCDIPSLLPQQRGPASLEQCVLILTGSTGSATPSCLWVCVSRCEEGGAAEVTSDPRPWRLLTCCPCVSPLPHSSALAWRTHRGQFCHLLEEV